MVTDFINWILMMTVLLKIVVGEAFLDHFDNTTVAVSLYMIIY